MMRIHGTLILLFLSATSLFAQKTPVKPAYLSKGDKVAIISASYFSPAEAIDSSAAVLRLWGFNPVIGPNTGRRDAGKYAGKPSERLNDLLWAIEDPEIKAIICSRGGYGTIHLLPYLHKELFAANPKWIVGYSDVTTLHSIETISGVMSLHAVIGDVLSLEGGKDPGSSLMREILSGRIPRYEVPSHHCNIPGSAKGILVGGNLSTLAPLCGSDWDILKEDTYILYIEDVKETYHHLDRLFNTLLLHGMKRGCKGVILGDFEDCKKDLEYFGVYDMLTGYLRGWDIPVLCSFPAGHGKTNLPLIMGAPVSLEVREDGATVSFDIDGEVLVVDTSSLSSR